MTPEMQAVVDRLMGLADEAIEDAEEAMRERCARGSGQRVYNQQKVEARAALRTAIEELALQAAEAADAKELAILRLKASTTLANNLCPDHRDKQGGKPCLACEVERLQKALASQPLVPPSMAMAVMKEWCLASQEAPAGWKIVPVEPTEEMVAAWPSNRHGAGHEAAIYRAMLATSPAVQEGRQELQSAYPWVWRYEISPDGKATTGYAFKTHEDCVEHCEPCGVKLVPAVQEAPAAEHAAEPAPAVQGLTDEQIDRMLSAIIPGGSQARDWFLPHETDRGLANVQDVVRRMVAALSAPEQAAQSPELSAEPPELTTGAEAAQQADARDAARWRRFRALWNAHDYPLMLAVIESRSTDSLDAAIDAAASKKEG